MFWKTKWTWLVAAAAMGGASVAVALNWQQFVQASGHNTTHPAPTSHTADDLASLVELVDGQPDTVRLKTEESLTILGVKIDRAWPAPSPEPLRLPGTLQLDPNRVIHVHSRFDGEVVSLGETDIDGGKKRPLQHGDRVMAGQVLAVIWSKEVGEKKSELVDSISRLATSKTLLQKLESLKDGVVAERTIFEARRVVEADTIAVAKAERTLRSWRIAEDEIEGARQEVKAIQAGGTSGSSQYERSWAETVIRAPIGGVIVEKNFNKGDLIRQEDDLFKIADLGRIMATANVYEEDLGMIRALPPGQRRWVIETRSKDNGARLEGSYELVGSLIDPAQRTGVIIGWLDNSEGHLAAGQFVTASIALPPRPGHVAIAESALIEDGHATTVFVETDTSRREFARRPIKIAARMAGMVHVQSDPQDGVHQPLRAGERVVVAGSLGMGGELDNLTRAAGKALEGTQLTRRN